MMSKRIIKMMIYVDDGSGVNKVTLNKKKYSASQSQTELREVKV